MLGMLRTHGQTLPLSPFVLRLRDSYLLGMAAEPSASSPCLHCVELWLTQRRVWSERLELSELPIRQDLIAQLQKENSPHLLFEVSKDGTETRMDCMVYPHPACGCNKLGFIGPNSKNDRLNFAFSPMTQIKCARYGIPSGNIWLTSASGSWGHHEGGRSFPVRTFATAGDREESRLKAVEQWMKQVAFHTFSQTIQQPFIVPVEDFSTGAKLNDQVLSPFTSSVGLGAGKTRQDAVLDALLEFGRLRTLSNFAGQVKKPMLVVGANNWIRNQVPFFVLQQYDLHLLFYPTSLPCWVVGLAAFSRVRTTEKPIFIFESHYEISTAMTRVLSRILEHCRPVDWLSEDERNVEESELSDSRNRKLSSWWNNWIYGCPKIGLKEVLHLDPYSHEIDFWRAYLRDGQERIQIAEINMLEFPRAIRHLVKLVGTGLERSRPSNVNGIGTLSSLLEAR